MYNNNDDNDDDKNEHDDDDLCFHALSDVSKTVYVSVLAFFSFLSFFSRIFGHSRFSRHWPRCDCALASVLAAQAMLTAFAGTSKNDSTVSASQATTNLRRSIVNCEGNSTTAIFHFLCFASSLCFSFSSSTFLWVLSFLSFLLVRLFLFCLLCHSCVLFMSFFSFLWFLSC